MPLTKRYLHPNLQNLCMCCFTQQKGLADVIELWILKWSDYPRLSGLHESLKVEVGDRRERQGDVL